MLPLRKLKPLFKKRRPRCPFYGFYGAMGVFLDQKGNQCSLIVDSYSPCQMEKEGDAPDWNLCPFNNRDNQPIIKQITKTWRVFPDEFQPLKKSEWKGIPFKKWFKYVMKQR